jgi:hypothetical protein
MKRKDHGGLTPPPVRRPCNRENRHKRNNPGYWQAIAHIGNETYELAPYALVWETNDHGGRPEFSELVDALLRD